MRTQRLTKKLFIIPLVAMLSACSTHYGAATIGSTPSGAEIIDTKDGRLLGTTPATLSWKEGNNDRKHMALRIKYPGYEPKVVTFWLNMSNTSIKKALANPQRVDKELPKLPDRSGKANAEKSS